MKNNFSKYGVSGMVDDNTGRILGFVPEEFGIWVPPQPGDVPPELVDVLGFSSIERVFLENSHIKGNPCLLFVVPEDWVVKNHKIAWRTRLEEIGWEKKDDTANLLDEFIGLAEAKPEKYLKFAKKWGPLWEQVHQPKEYTGSLLEEFLALFSAQANSTASKQPNPDKLAPWCESVETWRLHTQQVKGFLDIAVCLHKGEPAPLNYWESINISPDIENIEHDITRQRHWFSLFITGVISHRCNVSFQLNWSEEHPKLQLTSKLGFINAVWFQLLQAVSKMQVCVCDGCGKVYIREGKKPARGRNNFCPQCGGKGSKRLWAEKNSRKI